MVFNPWSWEQKVSCLIDFYYDGFLFFEMQLRTNLYDSVIGKVLYEFCDSLAHFSKVLFLCTVVGKFLQTRSLSWVPSLCVN